MIFTKNKHTNNLYTYMEYIVKNIGVIKGILKENVEWKYVMCLFQPVFYLEMWVKSVILWAPVPYTTGYIEVYYSSKGPTHFVFFFGGLDIFLEYPFI